MNKKKLLVIIVLVAAIAMVALFALTGGRSGRATACQNLIYGMERGDVEETYAMLSESAQEITPIEEWQEDVEFVQNMYVGREEPPELIEEEETESPIDGQRIIQETYLIESDFGPWHATCVQFESSDRKIGSFNNSIGVERRTY